MEWLTDEFMFYGGMALAGGTLLAGLLYFCISQIKKTRLNAQLDEEYGKNRKRK